MKGKDHRGIHRRKKAGKPSIYHELSARSSVGLLFPLVSNRRQVCAGSLTCIKDIMSNNNFDVDTRKNMEIPRNRTPRFPPAYPESHLRHTESDGRLTTRQQAIVPQGYRRAYQKTVCSFAI